MKTSDIEDQLDLFGSEFPDNVGESEPPPLTDMHPSHHIGISTDGQGDLFS